MNILLVRPKPHKATIGLQSIMVCEPLELEYLAAAVKGEHQVHLADMILEKKPLEYFIKLFRPRVVGITAYIAHVNVVKDYARLIKQADPEISVVVGGVHAEVVPEDFLDPCIDYIVSEDGLLTFPALLRQLERGEPPARGILPSEVGANNCTLPALHPDRSLSTRYRCKYYYVFHNPCALLKTSYGCPFSCKFCFCRQITRGNYRVRDLDDVIEEIKGISEPEIYIVDDNFLVDPGRVGAFCDLLEVHGINKRFLIYGRADFIARHEELIARFTRIGLRAVIVGVESPNPPELAGYDKQSSVEINTEAIRILAKYRVECYATLILGTDWDEEDFTRLYRWLKQNELRFVNLQPLTPLPGTPLYSQYQEQFIIPRERYEEWDLANLVVKPGRIPPRKYYFLILKLYFLLTLSFGSLVKNLRYGLMPNLRLSLGVARITWQYLRKIIRA